MKHKEQILKLRAEGKSYKDIVKILGCSKGTVCYHLGDGQKEKSKTRLKQYYKTHPFARKLHFFQTHNQKQKIYQKNSTKLRKIISDRLIGFCSQGEFMCKISVNDLIQKFQNNTTCYLTGDKIDINEPSTYQFDHIIPTSKGGDNSLENLGLCTKQANMSKTDMTPDEYVEFCKKILLHHGYIITKAPKTGIEPAAVTSTV